MPVVMAKQVSVSLSQTKPIDCRLTLKSKNPFDRQKGFFDGYNGLDELLKWIRNL